MADETMMDIEDENEDDDPNTVKLAYKDGTSHKFWNIVLNGSKTVTSWGRVGSKGLNQQKFHESEAAARKFFEKMVNSKEKKGYQKGAGARLDENSTL